ncbi:MAG TPA: aspartate kinase [Candidatus Acidoferrum sp.]|nr:aspartate kinase [Candidatus Acidoferrum sp.]
MSSQYAQESVEAEGSFRGRFVVASSATQANSHENVVALKFGGTSLLGAERMLHAASLVRAARQDSDVIVVVSAMKGVTDRLLSVSRALAEGKLSHASNEAEGVIHLHLDVLQDLQLGEEKQDRVRRNLQLLGRDLLHEVPPQGRVVVSAELADRFASFGERFSARLFAAALEKSGVPAVPVSSSDFVLTCDTFRDAKPQLDETKQRGRGILLPLLEAGLVPVVTGFIGATPDGRITTLGRNSSDFSGAIIAHVVDAEELVIWTDVDGVYTANPHDSVEAKLLHDLSYDEAHALAAGGAKVLHPHVLPLAAETEMTIWIRNTFKPHVRGTRIGVPQNANHRAQCGGAA